MERKGSSLAFEGMMWSVVMLSPSFISASPESVSAGGTAFGKGFMFGPRTTSTSAALRRAA